MKKALVVLLILAVAGGLFAQDLQWTGEVKTGLGLVYDTVGETAYLDAFSRNAEQPFQFRLNGAYENADKTAGVKFRFQQRFAFSIPYAFGYINAFDNLLTLQGGLIDDGIFNSGGGILDADSGEGLGTNVIVKLLDNKLAIGGGAYAASGFAIPSTGGTAYEKPDKAKYTAGLSFTLPDTFKFVTSFRTKNYLTADANAHNQTIVGVNVLALNSFGLKLVLEGRFTDLGENNEKDPMDVDAFVTVGYTKDSLSLGLNTAFYLPNINKPSASAASDDPILAFWLYGSYAVTESIVPRLDAVIMLNSWDDRYGNGDGAQVQWHYKNFVKDAGVGGNTDQKLIAFRPAVLLKMDAKSSLEIGDYIGIHLDKNKFSNDKDSAISNVFYIDYVLTF